MSSCPTEGLPVLYHKRLIFLLLSQATGIKRLFAEGKLLEGLMFILILKKNKIK